MIAPIASTRKRRSAFPPRLPPLSACDIVRRHDRSDPRVDRDGRAAGAAAAGLHGPLRRLSRRDARGTAQAPGLVMNPRVAVLSVDQLRAYLERGNPGAGMPAFAGLPADELLALAHYLRRINQETVIPPPPAPARAIASGPPQPGDWRTYNGNDSGNRYSPLTQIPRENVASLTLKWVFPMPHFGLEVTPLAADGILYVTGPNQVVALDAGTGQAVWTFSRPPTPGLDRRFTARHQPRGRAARGHGLLRHRQRAPAGARSRERRAAVGNADGARATSTSLVITTAARSRRSSCDDMVIAGVAGADPASAVSSRRSTPTTGGWCGGAGRCPRRGERGSRRGRAPSPSGAAGRPG